MKGVVVMRENGVYKEIELEQGDLNKNVECATDIKQIMQNLDSSQLKVEKNAFDAINSSDTSLNLVREGINEVEGLLGKINILNDAVEDSSKNIALMDNLSNMIAGFAKSIAGISSKTNMLSLNASIEAARAGEHGRGFAVVAGEVQNLASQSAKSSKEIEETIKSIQEFVSNMISDMNKILEIVQQQNLIVGNVDDILKKILQAAYVSNEVSRKMENEIAYQRNITDSAKNAVAKILEITDKIANDSE